jgi:hypothetical protein
MGVTEFVITNFQQILAVLAFVVWAVRLEAKVSYLTNETKRVEEKLEDNENKRVIQRAEDMSTIHQALRDIQTDIKLLLRDNK